MDTFIDDTSTVEDWQVSNDSAAMPHHPITPNEFGRDVSGLEKLYRDVAVSKANADAVREVIDLLERTAYALMSASPELSFPAGTVASDDSGGLSIKWQNGPAHLTLVVTEDDDDKGVTGDLGGDELVNRRLFPHRLASQLNTLARIEIEVSREELLNLLGDMKDGIEYPATDEMRRMAERIAHKPHADEEVDIEQWAKRLADDVAGAND